MSSTHARRLPGGRLVYDPRGTVTTTPLPPAPRLPSLAGIRLGILDNTKWNASKLLREVVASLQADTTPAGVTHHAKSSFSRPAPADLLDRIAAENDAVITAIGD